MQGKLAGKLEKGIIIAGHGDAPSCGTELVDLHTIVLDLSFPNLPTLTLSGVLRRSR